MQDTPPIPGVSIRRRLAVGGMAELFLADEELPEGKRPCVVKRLLPGAGAEERRLFEREALALAALSKLETPHVVKLYRAGPDWLLLEWVDGVDLATLLEQRRRRGRPLPIGAALAVAVGLAKGLEALLEAKGEDGQPLGLVHRDVHPGNVLLGKDGSVKLADLGVVAFTSAPTLAGLKGTLMWMAPEQLERGEATAATDVYAAGLIVYEALTGHPSRPIGAAGLAELMAARRALPTAPRLVRPELSPELEAAMLLPLAVNPAERPSVGAWLGALLSAAAPRVPQPAELAALIGDAPAALPAARTVVARAPEAIGAPPAATAWPRRAWPLALVALVVLGLVALVYALTSAPGPVPVEVETQVAAMLDGQGAGPDQPDRADQADRIEESGPSMDGVDVRVVASADTRAPEPETRVEELHAEPFEEISAALVEVAHVPETRAPREVVVAAPLHRVEVRPRDWPVHVRGQGVRGLAPIATPPLADGEALALELTGGAKPLTAIVRVRLKAGQVVASIGAPQGSVHRVDCGGRVRETPVFGIAVGAGGVACRLEASDGGTMAFVLSDVP